MSARPDPELEIAGWLRDEAPDRAPERLLAASRDRIQSTHQRRAWWPAWRNQGMHSTIRIALAAATVVAVVVAAVAFLPRSNPPVGGSGGQPSASPTPTPTAAASAAVPESRSPSPSTARFPDGSLAAGTYTTQPFAGPGGLCVGQDGCTDAGAEDDSIRVTLTVPDGWSALEGTAVVPSVEGYSPPGGGSLLFGRGGWLYTVSQVCGGSGPDFPTGPNIPTGTTVDEFVTALVDHPDLDVTDPVDATLGGYSGKYLELRAPANTTTDELGPDPSGCNYYFVWEPGIYAQGPNALWRIWVLDVDGIRVVVRSDSFPGTTPEVQTQLAGIVDSIQIER